MAAPERPARQPSALARLGRLEGAQIFIVLLVVIGVFMVTAPEAFLGYRIYMSFLSTVPPALILAVALTMVIIAGEIDLSFPSVVAFSGFLFAYAFKHYELVWLALALALAGGALVGFVNGFIIARLGIPSIIATLATLFLWGGVTLVLSEGLSLNLRAVKREAIHEVFVGRLFDVVPVQAFWALGVTAALWVVLNRHRFGEHLMFIGDNENVARVLGVNVAREKIKLFVLMGVLGAFAGVLLTLENANFFSTQGRAYLLLVMAAVFIGGTSIFGGEGTVVGSFVGSFIVGSIEAGIVASGIGGFWTRLIIGLVFLAAVIFHLTMEQPERLDRLRRWLRPSRPG